MNNLPIGLYVHVPFCLKLCPYCAFYKMPYQKESVDIFVDNLIKEISLYSDKYGAVVIDSLFFGGGTPNVLSQKHFEKIVSAIHDKFSITQSIEFSMEMNPGIHSSSKLTFLKDLGVNRVSVGVQSFHPNVLKDYDRNHSVEESIQFIESIRDVGFNNVSVDIIFGHPNHSKDDLMTSLNYLENLGVSHVALYGLTIEKGTPFHDVAISVDDDDQYEQYVMLQDFLNLKGFSQYEVSNFSISGFECFHNIKYWTLSPTIGLGAGAHTFFKGHRYSNTLDFRDYLIDLPDKLPNSVKALDWNDYISVRLRYFLPIYFSDIHDLFNFDMYRLHANILHKMSRSGFIHLTDEYFFVTQKGFPVLDEVICYLLN